jgi:hypothetical protein
VAFGISGAVAIVNLLCAPPARPGEATNVISDDRKVAGI